MLGFATEYGGILQTNQGAVSTLRGNLLGIARMAFGSEQFPYCPEIDLKNCALPAVIPAIRQYSFMNESGWRREIGR